MPVQFCGCWLVGTILILTAMVWLPGCDRREIPQRAFVAGPSMGERLPGEHRVANCPACGHRQLVDAHDEPDSGRMHCPLCGDRSLDWSALPVQGGCRVEVDESRREPARWDVVALTLPPENESGRMGIKRVWGLPGERIAFRNGDLWVNGRPVTKPPEVQASLWQLVFDSDHVGELLPLSERWVITATPVHENSGSWTMRGSLMEFTPTPTSGLPEASAASISSSQLVYRHLPGYPRLDPRQTSPLIEDHQPYNQGKATSLFPVRDLRVAVDYKSDARASLRVEIRGPGQRFASAGIRHGSSELFLSTSSTDAGYRLTASPISAPATQSIDLAMVDHGVYVANALVDQLPFDGEDDGDAGSEPMAAPELAIVAEDGPVTIQRIRIWRDIHVVWDHAVNQAANDQREVLLPADGYLVLGDNLAVSRDSRSWTPPWVTRAAILGLVKAVENP